MRIEFEAVEKSPAGLVGKDLHEVYDRYQLLPDRASSDCHSSLGADFWEGAWCVVVAYHRQSDGSAHGVLAYCGCTGPYPRSVSVDGEIVAPALANAWQQRVALPAAQGGAAYAEHTIIIKRSLEPSFTAHEY
jgi:hypothetical protein